MRSMPDKQRLPGRVAGSTRARVVLPTALELIGAFWSSSSFARGVVTRSVAPTLLVTTGRTAPAPGGKRVK